MTESKVSEVKEQEIFLTDYSDLVHESEILLQNREDYEGEKIFYCTRNFIGSEADTESENLLKKIILDLINFARIDNINIRFLFVGDAVKLMKFVETECNLAETGNCQGWTNVKFYFASESCERFLNEDLLEKISSGRENIEVLETRSIASMLMSSDVVTLT